MPQVHRAWYLQGPTPWSHPTLAVMGGRASGRPECASVAWKCWGLRRGVRDGDMQLGIGFSRAMRHGVGEGTGHPSWYHQCLARDQGCWGLLVMSGRCWGGAQPPPQLSWCRARVAVTHHRPCRAQPLPWRKGKRPREAPPLGELPGGSVAPGTDALITGLCWLRVPQQQDQPSPLCPSGGCFPLGTSRQGW